MATTEPSKLDQAIQWIKTEFDAARTKLATFLKVLPGDLEKLDALLADVGGVVAVIPGLNIGGYLTDIEMFVKMAEDLVIAINGVPMEASVAQNIGLASVKATGTQAKAFVRAAVVAKYSKLMIPDFVHDTAIQMKLTQVRKPQMETHLTIMAKTQAISHVAKA